MKNLTTKEKEMFLSWTKLFGKDTDLYKNKVEAYFKEKREIERFLKEKEGKEDQGLFKD